MKFLVGSNLMITYEGFIVIISYLRDKWVALKQLRIIKNVPGILEMFSIKTFQHHKQISIKSLCFKHA